MAGQTCFAGGGVPPGKTSWENSTAIEDVSPLIQEASAVLNQPVELPVIYAALVYPLAAFRKPQHVTLGFPMVNSEMTKPLDWFFAVFNSLKQSHIFAKTTSYGFFIYLFFISGCLIHTGATSTVYMYLNMTQCDRGGAVAQSVGDCAEKQRGLLVQLGQKRRRDASEILLNLSVLGCTLPLPLPCLSAAGIGSSTHPPSRWERGKKKIYGKD